MSEKIFKCEICGEVFTSNVAFSNHIALKHNLELKSYYDRFLKKEGEGICTNCGRPTKFHTLDKGYAKLCEHCRGVAHLHDRFDPNNLNDSKECPVCHLIIKSSSKRLLMSRFTKHIINVHHMTPKEYYDQYEKKPGEGICPECGKETRFLTIAKGYAIYCNDCKLIAANKKKQELVEKNQEFRKNYKEKIDKREEFIKNYIQELKNEAHKYDWEGTKATWEGGYRSKSQEDKTNLITDNSLTYIDGQSFEDQNETLEEKDEQSFEGQFWL